MPLRNPEAICLTCPYFGHRRTVEGASYGDCKYNPPAVFMLEKPEERKRNDEDYFPKTLFPQVVQDSWCGKHPDFYDGQPDHTIQHREM